MTAAVGRDGATLIIVPSTPVHAPSMAFATPELLDTHPLLVNPPPGPHVMPNEEDPAAAQSPIDWTAELDRAVAGSKAAASNDPRTLDHHEFRTAAAPVPEFGWSQTAIHRVQVMDEGGIVIRLNDNCALVLLPLPLAGCALGQKQANGALFDHLHDPPAN